jgi:serine protease Do
MMKNLQLKPLVLALAAIGVLAAGEASAVDLGSWFKGGKTTQTQNSSSVTAPAQPVAPAPATTPQSAGIPPVAAPNYRAIVQQYGPAVVGVTVEGTRKMEGGGLPPGMEDDPFFQFFRGLPGFNQRRGGAVPFKGQGSGFIVSSDGLILTNAHVVRDAKEVTVKLADRREYSAKVLGSDASTDIAVLRVSAKGLPVVRFGDPKQLQVGDPVLAIGAPYGFEQSATAGIVSAKGRSLPGDNTVVPFIQTDAAVNPGNSGGPLFDGAGGVVGINSQIYSQSGGYQGLAFAIPIDVAMRVKEQIVATGKAQHARIGVVVQDLNQSLAESFGMPRPDGALVARVASDSPAAKAGLKAGDVITEVNGEAIQRSGQLSSRIGLASPGDTVKLKVWRDKAAHDIEIKLGRIDDKEQKASADEEQGSDTGKLGLAMRPLTREERSQAKLDHGLVIEDVGGAAARAGIEAGDVLLAINGKPVTSVEQVKSVLAGKPKTVALLVQREGERLFVPVNLGS